MITLSDCGNRDKRGHDIACKAGGDKELRHGTERYTTGAACITKLTTI